MKIAKLLVLSMLWLFGQSECFSADLISRTAPEKPGTGIIDEAALEAIEKVAAEFEVGRHYVLYNTGAEQYFTQGNNWGTRASVGDLPLLVRFTLPEGKTLEDNALLFNDYDIYNNGWKNAFFDSATGIFVDRGSQANYFWQVVPQGNKVYRLQASPANPDLNPANNPGFVGRDPEVAQDNSNNEGSRDINLENCYPLSPFMESGNIDWVFYAVPEWDEYGTALDVYNKSEELRKQIETAEANGFDVSAAAAVYNNESATVEQMDTAIADLKAATTGGIGKGTADNPSDATAVINNPNFDDASYSGWSGTSPNMTGSGSHGPANVPEHYNKTFDTYQDIEGLPNGVYALKVSTFFRGTYEDYVNGTNQNYYPYLYTVAAGDTLSTLFNNAWSAMNTESLAGATEFGTTASETSSGIYYIPNDPSAFRVYAEKGFYQTVRFFEVTDGKARIGVKKDAKQSDTDWAIFDTFNLQYFGNTPESYKKWVVLSAPNINTEGQVYTPSYVENYEKTIAEQTATNKSEAIAAIEPITAAADLLKKNMALWKSYIDLAARAQDMLVNENLDWDRIDNEYDLSDWADLEVRDIIDEGNYVMTNEELEAEVTKWSAIIEEVKSWYKPVEVEIEQTDMLTNADFSGGKTGWTQEAASGGNVNTGGTSTNTCYEAWNNSNFDIYQIVKNAPAGIYRIEVQGFYRYGRTAYSDYLNQDIDYVKPGGAPVFVYMNSKATPFTNVYGDEKQITDKTFYSGSTDAVSETGSDGLTYYYPNGMASAAIAFEDGMYKQSAYGIIKEGQDMRIGVKGVSNQLNDSWCIWDNFKLYNCGKSKDAVMNVLPDEILNAKAMGGSAMGKSVYEQLSGAISAAETALSENDDDMFNKLSDLFDAEDAAKNSVATFASLASNLEDLSSAIAGSMAIKATLDEAKALYNKIADGISSNTFEDNEVEGLKEDIAKFINKLGLPSDMANATDENPVECTTAIINPDYIEGNDKGWTGGAAINGEALDAEKFNTNYNYYQVLQGMPAGTYQVEVQGFYRAGLATADYTAWKENPDSLNNAFLYAVGENADTCAVPMMRLSSQAVTADANLTDWTWASETDMMSVPNTMVTAANQFATYNEATDKNYYEGNVVTVKVGEDGFLTIGLKKSTLIANDWTLWTNWKLRYYGKDSKLTPDNDATGISETVAASAVATEFFSLSGARISKPGKGVAIMKQTLGDGTVKVRKVTVK